MSGTGYARSVTESCLPGIVVGARLAGPPSLSLNLALSLVGLSQKTCHRLIRFSGCGSVFGRRFPLVRATCGALASTRPLLGSSPTGFTLAWIDFLILPSLVIPSPTRGGTSRTRHSTNETRRRCQDWLNGVRLELWDPPKHVPTRAGGKFRSLLLRLMTARQPGSTH